MDSFTIGGHTILIQRSVCKVARLKQEFYYDIDKPVEFIEMLRNSKVKADLLTFLQPFPESEPKYKYYREWDNFAAIAISDYENWYRRQIQNPRVVPSGRRGNAG